MIMILTSLAIATATNTLLGDTLSDCQRVARLFDNTCPHGVGQWSNSESLGAVSIKCPSPDCAGGQCPIVHMTCVSCFQEGSQVYVRVQTSGLPRRCIGGRGSNFRLVDFTVKFNSPASGKGRSFKSQSEFDALACSD